jgi:hypothetical protein
MSERKERMFNKLKRMLVGAAALGALAVGGSAIAGAATSQSTATTTTTPSTTTPSTSIVPAMPEHGTAPHESAETSLTGATAAKAQAAAVKAVGSGTAGPVTSDYTGRGYETTVTKSDGTAVDVHLDSSFNAFQGGGGPGDAPGA